MMAEGSEKLEDVHLHAWHFVSGVLAWYDTIACTLPNSLSLIPEPWNWCETGFLSLERMMGCETWAMSQIRLISALRRWKDDMQDKRALSLRELSSRAAKIETALEDGLKVLETVIDADKAQDNLLAIEMVGDYGSGQTARQITRIFASAALTYLHTIVSGLNPKLPEIQSSVARTVQAIQDLPRLKFLCNLSWPLCITGALAVGQSRATLSGLITKYMSKPHNFGSSQHIEKILNTCWEQSIDEDSAEAFDYAAALRSLDLDILLV